MRWHDLLFAHWPVSVGALRSLIPAKLAIDCFDGVAWLGVVPFRMSHIRPRLLPAVPWLSAFLELNVRTYVILDGKPGVWFFSLDAANPVAVRGARRCFHLPYYDASMVLRNAADGWLTYRSLRTHSNSPPAEFGGRYRPTDIAFLAPRGSLDAWLTDRYCLYAADPAGRVYRGDIDHAPWPLQPAEAEIDVNNMTAQIGLTLPDTKPLLHFARRLDVVAWNLAAT
jgi:uncharacterized protein YqjF (DUF2071 family)